MQVIVFPDVEDLVRAHLAAELPNHGQAASVYVTIPNPRPDRFVTVPRVGGPTRNVVVDMPTLSVSSWGATPKQAHDLAQVVRGLINALPGQVLDGYPVYRVSEMTGPANLPDSVSGQPRYLQAFSVCIRGQAA